MDKLKNAKEYCLSVGSEFLSEDFSTINTKYKFKCTRCGSVFVRSYSKFKHSNQTLCLECSKDNVRLGKRLPENEVKEYIQKNSTSILLDIDYTITKSRKSKKLILKCECGKVYKQNWGEFKKSPYKKCPSCSNIIKSEKRKLDLDLVKNEFYTYGLEMIGKYINIDTDMDIKCDCGKIFKSSLYKIRQSKLKKCPKCVLILKGEIRANSHCDFLDKFKKELDYEEYEVLSEYKRSNIPIKFKHIKCGRVFETSSNNFFSSKTKCPYCYSSSGEKKIEDFLINNNIRYIPQYRNEMCKNIRSLPFDFYLLDYDIYIEYQGELHITMERIKRKYFGGIEASLKQTKNDLLKQKFCREKGVRLIPIWYYEKHQINKILKYLLKI